MIGRDFLKNDIVLVFLIMTTASKDLGYRSFIVRQCCYRALVNGCNTVTYWIHAILHLFIINLKEGKVKVKIKKKRLKEK